MLTSRLDQTPAAMRLESGPVGEVRVAECVRQEEDEPAETLKDSDEAVESQKDDEEDEPRLDPT